MTMPLPTRSFRFALLALGTTALFTPVGTARADQVFTENVIVDAKLCVGFQCADGEVFDTATQILLDASDLEIRFQDSSTSASFPTTDWSLQANNTSTSSEHFAIRNITDDTTPFFVARTAPTNALYLGTSGQIGMGTSIPQANLHLVSPSTTASLRMQSNTYTWEILTNSSKWSVSNASTSQQPVSVGSGASTNSLVVANNSKIGMGTNTPEELLHIQSNTANTDVFALFDANASGSDAAFLLRQNGTAPTTWEFRNQESSGRLNIGISGGNTPLKIDDGADNNLLKLGTNSNPGAVVVTGQLLVNNIALNVPDYVFADDYALRPLADVQAFIDTNSHLPDVPSEADIKANGVDMTQMQMTLLKKVEELTLYTLQQEAIITAQQVKLAEVDALRAEMADIKALLSATR